MKIKFVVKQILLIGLFLLIQLIVCNHLFACTYGTECPSGYCDPNGVCEVAPPAPIVAPTSSVSDTSTCSCCDQYSSPPETTDTNTYTKLRSTETQHTTTESPITRTLRASLVDPCRPPPALPDSCIVYRGDAAWLHCWSANSGLHGGIGCITAVICSLGIGAGCDIPNDTITAISINCNNSLTDPEKIRCIINRIQHELAASTSVCRNYARCFKRIWEEMGYFQTFISRLIGRDGHAWNEIETETGYYTVDAYNGILYWCPSGPSDI